MLDHTEQRQRASRPCQTRLRVRESGERGDQRLALVVEKRAQRGSFRPAIAFGLRLGCNPTRFNQRVLSGSTTTRQQQREAPCCCRIGHRVHV